MLSEQIVPFSQLPKDESGVYHNTIKAAYENATAGYGHKSMSWEIFHQKMHLWNAIMANSIVRGTRDFNKMVVLAGNGHVIYNKGISRYVAEINPSLRQLTIVIVDYENFKEYDLSEPLADIVIIKSH